MKKKGNVLFLLLETGFCGFLTTVAMLHGRGFVGEQMLYTMAFAAFCGFYWGYWKRISWKEMPRAAAVPAAVFALFGVAGHLFLVEVPVNLPRQAVDFLGFFCFYYVLTHGVFRLLDWDGDVELVPERWTEKLGKHPFGYCLTATCLLWAVPLVLKYPAGFCVDAYGELMQGIGRAPVTDLHPLGHSMLMGMFYKLGMALGSANLGLFLFVTVQALILAAVVSYGVHFLVRLRAPQWCVGLALAFFWFSPFVTGYVGQALKDAYFVTFFLLFVILAAELTLLPGEFWKREYRPLLLIVSGVGMVLMRNGVTMLLLPSVAVMVLVQRKRRSGWLRCGVLVLALLVPMAASWAVEEIYDPQQGSRRESLSLPFQQTARFARDNPELVTEEEKEVIRRVLPYDELAELYDPYLADPVKGSFNENSAPEDLMAYFGVWGKQFFRDPGCYLAATLEQNVFLFYPGYNNYIYYFSCDIGGEDFCTPPAIKVWQGRYEKLTNLLHQLPVVALLNNMAVYLMVFVMLACYAISRKGGYLSMTYLLPCLAVLVAIVAAPCIREHVRYAFPVMYALPILVGCLAGRKGK